MPYQKRDRLPLCYKAGVYVITNKVNGKVYVGSAVSIRGRLHVHRSELRLNRHCNTYLQRAWNKYGELAFKFDVLETCDPGMTLVKEQFWIDKLDVCNRSKGYNICPIAGNAMGGRNHSEASKKLMSRRRKGIIPVAATEAAAVVNRGKKRPPEVCLKIGAGRKGKRMSPEAKAKCSANHWTKGPKAAELAARHSAVMKGRTLSEEHKAKISASGKGKTRSAETKARMKAAHFSRRADAAEIFAQQIKSRLENLSKKKSVS